MEANKVIEIINTYGVLPILLFVIWKLWKMLKSEKEVSAERLKNMLGDDVDDKIERTKLIENNLSILEKYVEKNKELIDTIDKISAENHEEHKEVLNDITRVLTELKDLRNLIKSIRQ